LPSFASLSQSAEIGLSKGIFYVKNHSNISDFFFIEEYDFRTTFFVKMIFFVTSILKPPKMVNQAQFFDEAAKLGKASRDAYNPGLWLIL
jgi:hypothetical protein